ncbi:GNAT family N-acetyltransferase [Novosphingobium aquimarinum]|uniref:GNAT family N-acetyltransferase n=1 Tax=Novosphingobium aquimarinum TaxID=2682494 RepID=UPI0018DD075D|nr:GNAT family N-acetyltransferase [Novosphingobium aquimarinum]
MTAVAAKLWRDHVCGRQHFFIMERPLQTDGSALPQHAESQFVRIDRVGDLPPLGGWLTHRRGDFERLLARGSQGYMALKDGIALGCVWYAPSDTFEESLGVEIPVRQGQAYFYGLLIDPEQRRVGLGAKLTQFVLRDMASRGFDNLFMYCEIGNLKSFRIMSWLGFRCHGTMIEATRVFGRTVGVRTVPAIMEHPKGWRAPRRILA